MTLQGKSVNPISVRYKLIILLLSIIGSGIIIFATSQHGIGISPDSVGYIATGRHIADGIGFISYDNKPLTVQPPLYPIVLGFIDFLFEVDPLVSANFISAIFFGLTLYVSGILFLKNISPPFAFLGVIFLLISIPLIKVSLMAWSEPPFIFFIALYLFFLERYIEKRNVQTLLFFALTVALAFLTRYIGSVLILAGGISILMVQHNNLKSKILHALYFAILSLFPISIWLGRNYILSGTLFGPRAPSVHSLHENILYTFYTLADWFLPPEIINTKPKRWALTLGVVLGCFLIFWKANVKAIIKQIPWLAIHSLLFVFSYTAFLIISSTTTHYDAINNRLLSPIFIPTILIAFFVIEFLYKEIQNDFPNQKIQLWVTISLVFVLIHPAFITVQNLIEQFHNGRGFNAKQWKNSETLQYIRENNIPNYNIYTNGGAVVYHYLTVNVKSIPAKTCGSNTIAKISSLNSSFPLENKAYLVWFNALAFRTYFFTPDELMSIVKLEKTIQLEDGTIYVISKK